MVSGTLVVIAPVPGHCLSFTLDLCLYMSHFDIINLFTCNYVVSVRRGFLFLWVLGMGYVFYFLVALGNSNDLCLWVFVRF